MKRVSLLLLLLLVTSISRAAIPAANRATVAFHKLLTLVGDWEGKDEHGAAVKTNFKFIAGKTALMETLDMPGMDEMVTLYSIDGDTIALMHYCPTGNQPRLRATPPRGNRQGLHRSREAAKA